MLTKPPNILSPPKNLDSRTLSPLTPVQADRERANELLMRILANSTNQVSRVTTSGSLINV